MCMSERKNSGARVPAVPGNVDAQTFASLLSLIPTLSQISVWMYIIPLIQRAQEQWIDTEYFCYHYSLSVKCRMQLLDILTKNCVSSCPCWFCYTYEPLISPRKWLPCWNKWLFLQIFFLHFSTEVSQENQRTGWWGLWHMPPCHSAVGFIQQDSLAYQQLEGNLVFISMLVMLCYFLFFTRNVILQPRCRHEWEQIWLELTLQWTKAVLAAVTEPSTLFQSKKQYPLWDHFMQTFTDQVSRGDDGFGLVWFFSIKSWRHSRRQESLQL